MSGRISYYSTSYGSIGEKCRERVGNSYTWFSYKLWLHRTLSLLSWIYYWLQRKLCQLCKKVFQFFKFQKVNEIEFGTLENPSQNVNGTMAQLAANWNFHWNFLRAMRTLQPLVILLHMLLAVKVVTNQVGWPKVAIQQQILQFYFKCGTSTANY